MKKMFAGIVGIEFNEERRLITAMLSREGERVELQPPVDLNDAPKVNDWLRRLEHTMQATLSKLLDVALTHLTKFDISSLTHKDLMDWLDHYPVSV
jgi:dynein heavy chain 1